MTPISHKCREDKTEEVKRMEPLTEEKRNSMKEIAEKLAKIKEKDRPVVDAAVIGFMAGYEFGQASAASNAE